MSFGRYGVGPISFSTYIRFQLLLNEACEQVGEPLLAVANELGLGPTGSGGATTALPAPRTNTLAQNTTVQIWLYLHHDSLVVYLRMVSLLNVNKCEPDLRYAIPITEGTRSAPSSDQFRLGTI